MGIGSFISNLGSNLVHGVEKGIGDVVHGVEDVGQGLGKLTLGALTGNGKEAFEGVKDIGKGAFDAFEGGKDLAEDATPEGAAAQVLLAGAKAGIQELHGDGSSAPGSLTT